MLDLLKSFPTNRIVAEIGVDTFEYEPLKVRLIFNLRASIFADPPRFLARVLANAQSLSYVFQVNHAQAVCSSEPETLTVFCLGCVVERDILY